MTSFPTTPYFERRDGQPSAAGEALRRWHSGLEENERATRARLARAESPDAVSWVPGFYALLAPLSPYFEVADEGVRRTLAAVAGLAARVRADDPGVSVAGSMAQPLESPRVSEARFRRLVALDDFDERYRQLARLIALLDRRVNLCGLADAVTHWPHDRRLRQRWAYDYFKESA